MIKMMRVSNLVFEGSEMAVHIDGRVLYVTPERFVACPVFGGDWMAVLDEDEDLPDKVYWESPGVYEWMVKAGRDYPGLAWKGDKE